MKKEFEKFNISQVGILIKDDKCMILEFADHLGFWGLPGGRVDKGEDGNTAFKREIREEIGFKKFENIGVVDYDIWYVGPDKPVCGIANLIFNDNDEIKLSDEHSQIAWISEGEIDDYKFLWPNISRMIRKGFGYYRLLRKINAKQ